MIDVSERVPNIEEIRNAVKTIGQNSKPGGLTEYEYLLFQEAIAKLVTAHDSMFDRVGDCDGCSETRDVISTIANWFLEP